MKTSIYHNISNFPQNCRCNTRKTDKVYNFLQSAKLTCVGDLWTQALRSFSQSPRGNLGSTSLADVIWYIAGRFSEFKGHLCGLEEIVDFVRFPCVVAAILEKIADNVINGSLSTIIKCLPHTQCSFTPSKFPTFFMNVKIETPFGSLCPSPFQ